MWEELLPPYFRDKRWQTVCPYPLFSNPSVMWEELLFHTLLRKGGFKSCTSWELLQVYISNWMCICQYCLLFRCTFISDWICFCQQCLFVWVGFLSEQMYFCHLRNIFISYDENTLIRNKLTKKLPNWQKYNGFISVSCTFAR